MFRTPGIIRRIDSSGRISIPRELRKKYRLEAETPVEISEYENNLILRKYSSIGEFTDSSKSILKSFSAVTGLPVILCDTDVIVASCKTAYLSGKMISDELHDNIKFKSKLFNNIKILCECDIVSSEAELIYSADREIIGALIIPECGKQITVSQKECLRLCAKAVGGISI